LVRGGLTWFAHWSVLFFHAFDVWRWWNLVLMQRMNEHHVAFGTMNFLGRGLNATHFSMFNQYETRLVRHQRLQRLQRRALRTAALLRYAEQSPAGGKNRPGGEQ